MVNLIIYAMSTASMRRICIHNLIEKRQNRTISRYQYCTIPPNSHKLSIPRYMVEKVFLEKITIMANLHLSNWTHLRDCRKYRGRNQQMNIFLDCDHSPLALNLQRRRRSRSKFSTATTSETATRKPPPKLQYLFSTRILNKNILVGVYRQSENVAVLCSTATARRGRVFINVILKKIS